ncbi:tRNA (adenosine(37)-N6)-threonylcarbamoyltransferase complex ATPase subunit type 1 TsaE [Olivibacter ginsenosidimutans]|uniref:tRNA threonylcarbamoyladenosine biosynthesis protein TsaE n=1 Tax=Olivibacter ginsenosidimutans TaxID=1176537 RepID=A0ABP9AMB9_9SPHI
MTITVAHITELPEVAEQLLHFIGNDRVVLFFAPMGAGKTTLINALCQQLQTYDQPSSPTFAIVNEYTYPKGKIYHFDCYRLKYEHEALDLGYEDYFFSGNYCFIEWPEKIPNLLPDDVTSIRISLLPNGTRKVIAQKGLPVISS